MMTNLISKAVTYVGSLLKELQVKRFLVAGLVGFLLLTSGVAFRQPDIVLGASSVDKALQQDTADRPKTTGEWNKEARETAGDPGKQLQRIGKESAEAFKQFGAGYGEGAKETARDVKKNADELGD